MSISKIEVFSSNLNAPANFSPVAPEEKRDFFNSSLYLTQFFCSEDKPNRCGNSLENCRVKAHRGSSPLSSAISILDFRLPAFSIQNRQSKIQNQTGNVAQSEFSAALCEGAGWRFKSSRSLQIFRLRSSTE